MKTFAWIAGVCVALFLAFVIGGNALYARQHSPARTANLSPQAQSLAAIQKCRRLPHDAASIAAGQGMDAGACEAMAIVYARKYHEVP